MPGIISSMPPSFRRPTSPDRLFESTYLHAEPDARNCDQCDNSKQVVRPPRPSEEPEVHYGLIASGNSVIKDARRREFLQKAYRPLCFEMEAAGVMNDLPCIVIRGICDYCDSHKNKDWQNYAAATAAAWAKELLLTARSTDILSMPKALKEGRHTN